MSDTHVTAPTQYIEVDGERFAYRRWGNPSDVPIFLVQHFRGGMDNWDPLLTDGLAEGREVILFNGRGIASSSGMPRNRVEDMADDIAAVIRALGLEQVDLLGFSLGVTRHRRSRCATPSWYASSSCSAPASAAGTRRWTPRCPRWR
jgi:pimeloyl-ACP methyl ester carboxylesterase